MRVTIASRADPAEAGQERTGDTGGGIAPTLARNAVGLGLLWVFYSTVRAINAESWTDAFANADRLMAFQDWLGLPSEAVLQQVVLGHEGIVRAANTYYVVMHFPVMIVFLAWAMALGSQAMPRIRLALIGSTMAGLLIHLAFPLAPPRMLDFGGFVDTAREVGPDPYALGVAKAANELAAMPSMHVGWALLIALAVVDIGGSRWRWIVMTHPAITTVVVVVTANHYWTDVVAGAALSSVGWWLAVRLRPMPIEARPQRTVSGSLRARRAPLPRTPPPPGPTQSR